MQKLLNYLSAIFGISLFIAGILKSLNLFYNLELHLGELFLIIPNSNSILFNVFVNFIGGFSMTFHSIATLKFIQQKHFISRNEIINFEILQRIKLMSKFTLYTGIITIIISTIFYIKLFVVLSYFDGSFIKYLPLMILVILIFVVFSSIPIIVVTKNLSLQNQIEKMIKYGKKM